MSKLILDRRTMLRGMTGGLLAQVALPCLDAMVNGNGNAHADGTAFPQRFALWFWGCGVVPKMWTPVGTGAGWTPPAVAIPISAPLAANPVVKSNITVLSGFEPKGGGSHYAVSTMLSGEYASAGYRSPTIDVVLARELKSPTRFPSLVLAVSHGHKPGEGFPNISNNGPKNVNPPEYSPLKLFGRLFNTGSVAVGTSVANALKARKSMLDGVMADATTLRATLGASDKARLEQYLENLRTLEKQLAIGQAGCPVPTPPTLDPPTKGYKEELEPIDDAMTALLAVAFSCDLTRVASYAFTTEETGTIFWQVGANAGYHDGITHRTGEGDNMNIMIKAMAFQMQRFARFIEALQKVREGAGSLLDSCCVYATSGVAEPRSHQTTEMPIILAGRAGGKLKTGFHHRSPGDSSSKVLLTVLNAMGVRKTEFGVGPARATETIGALEAG